MVLYVCKGVCIQVKILCGFSLVAICDLWEDRGINDVTVNFFTWLYKKKFVDSILLCISSVINHRWCQNVVRASWTHSRNNLCATFWTCHIFVSSVICCWVEALQHGIYLVNSAAVSYSLQKYFGRISGAIILFVSSKRRRLEARNFAVIFIFIPFTTYEKTSFAQ